MKNKKLFRLLLLSGLIAVTFPVVPVHADMADKAMQVAIDADKAIRSYVDYSATLEMVLTSKQGETATRVMRVKNFESGEGLEKSLIVFESPKDLQGTGLLSYSKRKGDDEQWLYLPAIARVKQIASKNKSGPFMGGEFAFEDLGSQYWEKYKFTYLREELLGDVPCDVIERDPVDEDSGYSKQEVWIDKKEHLVRKTIFYDKKGLLLKTYVGSGFQQYGSFWRPSEMEMVNHQTGKSTKLIWKDYHFKNGFSDADFTQNSLMRVK